MLVGALPPGDTSIFTLDGAVKVRYRPAPFRAHTTNGYHPPARLTMWVLATTHP